MSQSKIISVEALGFPWKTLDPFIFCVYHRDEFPAGNENMGVDFEQLQGRNVGQDFVVKDGWRMYHGSTVPGFPYHPHRGFETITINKEGLVDHTDSLGASGRFGPGDVQWMTAGKGVQHSEMFPLVNTEKGNPLEIFQIWLNLPASKKMVEPHFKMLWADMIPILNEADSRGRNTSINLIAGRLGEMNAPSPTPDSWAAYESNGVMILTVKMEAGASWTLPAASKEFNRVIYFYKGESISIEESVIPMSHSIQVDASADIQLNNGNEESFLLILQGRPINEPVAQYGPFVMNTDQEIQEAFADFRRTQFGGWPWPEHEQVHSKSSGRFAKHADGRMELKQ